MGPLIQAGATLILDLAFLTEYVYSPNLGFGESSVVFRWIKINLSTIGTMRRTAITVNYLQMLCLLVVLSSFFEELL